MFQKRATGYNIGEVGMCLCFLVLATATIAVPRAKQTAQTASRPVTTAQRALLDQYCIKCHNQQVKTAGLMLDKADLNDIPGGAETWEKVVMKLRSGMMPPVGHFGVPEDIAGAVHFLCLPTSGFITGQTLHVNGGQFLP